VTCSTACSRTWILRSMARAHRIGQTRAVRVYRLLTAKTYEMHMFHSASMKLGLERAVLAQQREQGDEGEAGKSKSKSEKEAHAKEIDSLLKKGAYDVFKEEDDEEAQKFMETDIDQLLESNTQTVTYNSTGGGTSSSGGLGSFSKASFVTDTGDGEKDVDLDDPDFWRKAAGLVAPVETPEDVAQMLDDGVKRSRKQVQQFNPFEDYFKNEQAKEDKRLQKVKEEKEEKDRLRLEKKMKKLSDKERRTLEKQETREPVVSESTVPAATNAKEEVKFKLKKKPMILPTSKHLPKDKSPASDVVKDKPIVETKLTRPKKSGERKRAQLRAQFEDPEIERLKQGWDVPHRNRAVSACLRFGFDRFCKIRGEANLTSLPIQDIEVFFRSYFFQLSLQLVVLLLQMMKREGSSLDETTIKHFLTLCLDSPDTKELNWLGDCIFNGMKSFHDIEANRRYFRVPMILAEQSFVTELRNGAALRALRRIFTLGRLIRIIEDCLDEILTEIGYEQLAKRGCPTSNLGSLDVDLKIRVVSTEELLLIIGSKFKKVAPSPPAAWWDRSCDIALLIGTFVHGLGNYDAMVNDDSLPFASKIKHFARSDEACIGAQKRFSAAAKVSGEVFYQALEAAKAKDQLQIQAAVAAAAAASSEREKSALALREGGEAATTVDATVHDTPADKLYDTKDDDSHFITLHRLKKSIVNTVRSDIPESDSELLSNQPASSDANDATEEKTWRRKASTLYPLCMPDGRVLDHRLIRTLSEIERHMYPDEDSPEMDADAERNTSLWPCTEAVSTNRAMKQVFSSRVFGPVECDNTFEGLGIGLHGIQSGSTHRTLDDGSDFVIGSANHDLSQIAYGPDAPRFLRAIGVPMNITRYAVAALMYADDDCLEAMLALEKDRNATRLRLKPETSMRTDLERKNVPLEASSSKTVIDSNLGDSSILVKKEDSSILVKKEDSSIPVKKEGEIEQMSTDRQTHLVPEENVSSFSSAMDSQAPLQQRVDSDHKSVSIGIPENPPNINSQDMDVDPQQGDGHVPIDSEDKGPIDRGEQARQEHSTKEEVDADRMEMEGTATPVSSDKVGDVAQEPVEPVSSSHIVSSSGQATQQQSPIASSSESKHSEPVLEKASQVKVEGKPDQIHLMTEPLNSSGSHLSVPMVFLDNPTLRAGVCGTLLYYGCPLKGGQEEVQISNDLVDEGMTRSFQFNSERFMEIVKEVSQGSTVLPSFHEIEEYIFGWLLPHCLRLCLMGNGPTLENARGSRGEYETALGITLYPEPKANLQCLLPDPCLALEEHSMEAIASAYAILRRHHLMRCAMQLATGKVVPVEKIHEVLRSSFMGKSMSGLPIWWCPWIHDAALLAHAASRGLFAIFQDRYDAVGISCPSSNPLSHDGIMQHLQTHFISSNPSLTSNASVEDIRNWMDHQAKHFPSPRVLERRLACLCAKLTEHFLDDTSIKDGCRYDNLPMFDHGAWPRN